MTELIGESLDHTGWNLIDKRDEFCRELCRNHPSLPWRHVFEIIMKQDKEFIRRLKEIPIIKQMGIGGEIITKKINELAGSKLI